MLVAGRYSDLQVHSGLTAFTVRPLGDGMAGHRSILASGHLAMPNPAAPVAYVSAFHAAPAKWIIALMDPLTIAKLWLAVKPVKKWKAAAPITRFKMALNKRRARKGKPLLEINEDTDMGMLKELLGSMARTFLPAASAYLAGQGITLSEGSEPVVTLVLAGAIYGAMQAWSWWRKFANKPRSV